MDTHEGLAGRFEEHRSHLRSVAYRLLGSLSEADDAVQEAWLRLYRSDVARVHNLGGWLTTVVGRVCLDMLRSRTARREEPLDAEVFDAVDTAGGGPEQSVLMADAVGVALLVVLDTLDPAERLAFVLHDMFAVPHREIARILDRTPAATKMLTSRARRRVQTADTGTGTAPVSRGDVIDAFLAASRDGDFDALLALLDPDAIFRTDHTAVHMGAPPEIRGAARVAGQFSGRAQAARAALVDGVANAVWLSGGTVRGIINFTIDGDKIIAIDVVADPTHIENADVMTARRSGVLST